jgi:hypothetical protein
MGYSENSIAAGAIGAVVAIPACINLACSAWTLHDYLRHNPSHVRSSSAGRTKYPLLLRSMFVLTNIGACLMSLIAVAQPWLYVDDGIRIEAFQQTSVQEYSLESRWCTALTKTGTSLYGMTKLFSYLFFFIKQRTVRPMNPPSWQERIIFSMTLGIFVFSAFVLVIAEGDANSLDNTCQLYLPIWIQILMLVADVILSFGFLYLFIQPLRVTIRNNQQVRSTAETQPPATAKVASSDRISISVPSGNNSLEEVMRKNTYACVITVVVSFCSLVFMITAHTTDDPYLRKWVTPIGQADALFTALALSHIMRKPAKAGGRDEIPSFEEIQIVTAAAASDQDAHSGRHTSRDNRVHPALNSPGRRSTLTAPPHQTSPTQQSQPSNAVVPPLCDRSSSSASSTASTAAASPSTHFSTLSQPAVPTEPSP